MIQRDGVKSDEATLMLDVRIFQHEYNVETMNVDQKKIKNCVKGRLCVCVCVCVCGG